MSLATYTPTTWVNNTAPELAAGNLNHNEQGLKAVTDEVKVLGSVLVECEVYADNAQTSATNSASSASASATSATNSSNSADRAETVVDGAISASVSASVSASIIAIQPSVTACETSASNAYISELNADLSETACLNYKNIMDDAISTNIPSFTFNPTTGHLAYTGGTINFSLNTEKHLLWEVQL